MLMINRMCMVLLTLDPLALALAGLGLVVYRARSNQLIIL